MFVFFVLLALTACVTSGPNQKETINTQDFKQRKFVRYRGIQQRLYYPSGFYSEDINQAQARTARAWWNQ